MKAKFIKYLFVFHDWKERWLRKGDIHLFFYVYAGAISSEQAAAVADEKAGTLLDWSRRLAALEMRELNERERCNHLQRLFAQQKGTLDEYLRRNAELENNFAQVGVLKIFSYSHWSRVLNT